MSVSPLPHRHHWEVRSTHPTSEGRVRYLRCICGEWQVVVVPAVDRTDGATPVGRIPSSHPVDRSRG
jgi:hypothetical protein